VARRTQQHERTTADFPSKPQLNADEDEDFGIRSMRPPLAYLLREPERRLRREPSPL